MSEQSEMKELYGSDVQTIALADKTVVLVGTAHVSQESVALVRRVIEQERPDCVCLELDANRYQALASKERWQSLDIKSIIKQKQLSTLIVNLLMASYQKRLGLQMGVIPGAELLAAAETAEHYSIPFTFCDRDVRITLRRAWKATSFWKKNYLLATLLASLFDKEQLDEEKLTELRKKDVLANLLDELGSNLPGLKKVLIDERDIYLAEKIKTSPGQRLVAVVGAGHLQGIIAHIHTDNSQHIEPISVIPPVSTGWKLAGWSIPALILVSIAATGYLKGIEAAGENMLYWILATGVPAAFGGLLALGHPLTILSAFLAAPVTTLSPVIGAGHVTAFVQAMQSPPLVKEIELVGNDLVTFTGWWRNKLLRILLVFFFTGLGAAIGTWFGGYRIFSDLVSR